MSKIINDEYGNWNKTIINPGDTVESSDKLIDYATNALNIFSDEKRIVTKMEISVEYNNSTDTLSALSVCNDNIHIKIAKELEEGLLVLEESSLKTKNSNLIYKEDTTTLRDKLISYLDIICSKGMMNSYQYKRFSNTLYKVYGIITNNGCNSYVDIKSVLNNMNMDYTIKHFQPTAACPEEFFKLIKNNNEAPLIVTTVNEEMKQKLDEFIRKWFDNGKRKIYDKDRDEFYIEFMTLYDSINKRNDSSDKGVIAVTRRSIPRTKKVIGMKPLINHTDINKILRHYGLNYSIQYHQETEKTDNGYKRRNLLSLE